MCPILLHRHYERRCKACGYVWEVSRREAEMRPPSINRFEALGAEFPTARQEGVSEQEAIRDMEAEEDSRLEDYETTRRCPSCGIDDFTERPITSSHSRSGGAPVKNGVAPAATEPPLGTLAPGGEQFWDGTEWVSTLSADGRLLWNGTNWVAKDT